MNPYEKIVQDRYKKKNYNPYQSVKSDVSSPKPEKKKAGFWETLGDTALDIFGGIGAGVSGLFEGITDSVVGLAGGIGGMFGADTTWAEDFIKNDWTGENITKPLYEITDNSLLGDTGKAIVQGVGQMLPVVGAGFLTGGASLGLGGILASSGGGGMQEALNDGAGYGQALGYGALQAGTEGLLEAATGGIGRMASLGGKVATKGIAKQILKEAGSEALEEGLSAVINPLSKTVYKGSEALKEYQDPNFMSDVLNSAIVGGAVGGLVQGGGHAVGAVRAGGTKQYAANDLRTQRGELQAEMDTLHAKGELSDSKLAGYKQAIANIDNKIESKLNSLNAQKQEKYIDKYQMPENFEVQNERLKQIKDNDIDGIRKYNKEAFSPSLNTRQLSYSPTEQRLTNEQIEARVQFGNLNKKGARIVYTDALAKNQDGTYKDGIVYVSTRANAPKAVIKHELTHSLEETKEYGKYAINVLQSIAKDENIAQQLGLYEVDGKKSIDIDIAGVTELYLKVNEGKPLAEQEKAVLSELVAKYTSEKMFTDEAQIARLSRDSDGTVKRIYNYIKDKIDFYTQKKHASRNTLETLEFLRGAEKLYKKVLNTKQSVNTGSDEKFFIKQDRNGKYYVQADRKVLSGSDPKVWKKELTDYINNIIRKGEDVQFKTLDGETLTITKNTAGKGGYWNEDLDESYYKTKLNAEAHIDELTQVATAQKDAIGSRVVKEDKNNKHAKRDLAKDGWSYYNAYFKDFDASMYKITFSVANDGDVQSIYNIGKVTKKTSAKGVNPIGSSKAHADVSNNSISQKIENVNVSTKKDENIKFSLKDENPKQLGLYTYATDNLNQKLKVATKGFTSSGITKNFLYGKSTAKVDSIVNEIQNKLVLNGKLESGEDVKYFDRIFKLAEKQNTDYYQTCKEHYDYIKSSEIDFSNIEANNSLKQQIQDKKLFKIRYGEGVDINKLYLDLSKKSPDIFKKSITNPSARLDFILKFMDDTARLKSFMDTYNTKFEYDAMKYNFIEELESYAFTVRKLNDMQQDKIDKQNKKAEKVEHIEAQKVEFAKMNEDEIYAHQLDKYKELSQAEKYLAKMRQDVRLTDEEKRIAKQVAEGLSDITTLSKKYDIKEIEILVEAERRLIGARSGVNEYRQYKTGKDMAAMDELIKNTDKWKDKSGFAYSRETPYRNFLDIAGEDGQGLVRYFVEPLEAAETARITWLNSLRKRIKEVKQKFTRRERELVQMIKEGIVVAEGITAGVDFKKLNSALEGGADVQLSNLEKQIYKQIQDGEVAYARRSDFSENQFNEIKQAVEVLTEIYNEVYEAINKSRVLNGYAPVPFRKNYAPHFYKDTSAVAKFFEGIGFDIFGKGLPTDIIGLTKDFRPGTKWVGNFLQRKGKETTFDFLEGFDIYIEPVSISIYHTDNMQKYRKLETAIRYKYSDDGVKAKIDAVRQNMEMDEEQKQTQLDTLYATDKSHLNNFVVWLRNQANVLAGKKSDSDRIMECMIGRGFKIGGKDINTYKVATSLYSRVAANMVGANISSALTNFIPITQAFAGTSTGSFIRGLVGAFKNLFIKDNFELQSGFITRRRGSDALSKSTIEKASDAAGFLFRFADNFTSNVVVRAKYAECIKNGMTHDAAMAEADRFAANVMVDRSLGSMPTIFNAKNIAVKTLTMFQAEVNNQFSYIFKDLPRSLRDKGKLVIMLAMLKLCLGAWLFNELYEKLIGRRPAFDPINMVVDSVQCFANDNLTVTEKLFRPVRNVAEELPFIGGLMGGGRIPISSALPDIGALADGESTMDRELSKVLWYLLPPFGGGQLKKTIEGVTAYSQGGVYGSDADGNKKLKYTIDQTFFSGVQAVLFGKSAIPETQKYYDKFDQSTKDRIRAFSANMSSDGGSVSVMNEIDRLYKEIDSKDVLPPATPIHYYKDEQKIYMSASEYKEYDTKFRTHATDELKKLFESSYYKKLTDEQKASAVKKVYSYAKDFAAAGERYELGQKIKHKDLTIFLLNIDSMAADVNVLGKTTVSRKDKVIKYINGLFGLTKQQKQILLQYAGYKA